MVPPKSGWVESKIAIENEIDRVFFLPWSNNLAHSLEGFLTPFDARPGLVGVANNLRLLLLHYTTIYG